MKILTWLKHRPLLKCPNCGGTGWAPRGYDDERYECETCFNDWVECRWSGMPWTEGRVRIVHWLRLQKREWTRKITKWLRRRGKASLICGEEHWRCFFGWHSWGPWRNMAGTECRTCRRCYEMQARPGMLSLESER